MRTPLARVRGLGSAREGTDHFWKQRISAVSNLLLIVSFVAMLVALAGSDYMTTRAVLASPIIGLVVLATMLSVTFHMRLGMQVIIEDYVHSEGAKVALLIANTFFCILIALASAVSVLKIVAGG